jgi:hypothetical protein
MPQRILDKGIVNSIRRMILNHPGVTLLMSVFEVVLVVLYALAVRGLCNQPHNRIAAATLLGIAVYFLLISGGAQAVGRYRLPVMPILCLFAAAGIPLSHKKQMRDPKAPHLFFANTFRS